MYVSYIYTVTETEIVQKFQNKFAVDYDESFKEIFKNLHIGKMGQR